ncbi:MAG: OmpA family protein [Breznakibacter sp.]
MRLKVLVICILCITSTLAGWSQKKELKKAVSFFDRGEYFLSLDFYKQAQDKGAVLDASDRKRIAQCYYFLNDIDKAFTSFSEIESQLTGNDVFLYASTIHKFGFYEGAIEWYEKSKAQGANPMQVSELINSCKWALENQDLVDYRVNPSSLATFGQSFGIQYYKDGVVYSSANEGATKIDKQGKAILNLFYSDISNGEIEEGSRLFSKNLEFPSHVGAISFTSDFKYMYFTKAVRKKNGSSGIKIFMVEYDGRDWVNETEIAINSDDFDCAHPAISPDDKFIYFVSNKKGGYGGKDLYYAERKGPNSFGMVKNFGNDVNTFGDEMFPFMSKDNKLYFSSDGHLGFGGLDIFSAEMVNGKWTNVTNLMKPFNSNRDDFGYVVDPKDPTKGFLSSNNFGNATSDVIFYVRKADEAIKEVENTVPIAGLENIITRQEEVPAVVEQTTSQAVVNPALPSALKLAVTSTFNGTLVGGAEIILNDPATGAVVARGLTGANGRCDITIPDQYRVDQQEFELVVSKGSEFNTKKMIVNILEIEDLNQGGILLTPIFNDQVLDDISGMSFHYQGEEISGEAAQMLDKLAAYMLSNSGIVVKLNGHTEARGNRIGNLNRSQTMAEKAKAYLVSKGVDGSRLIPRGYGERYLLNKCRRGIYCEPAEHAKNRRVEVVVWKIMK